MIQRLENLPSSMLSNSIIIHFRPHLPFLVSNNLSLILFPSLYYAIIFAFVAEFDSVITEQPLHHVIIYIQLDSSSLLIIKTFERPFSIYLKATYAAIFQVTTALHS